MATSVVHIEPLGGEAEKLWSLALELAQALGPEREWSLIGGLMVQLQGLEHGDELRKKEQGLQRLLALNQKSVTGSS